MKKLLLALVIVLVLIGINRCCAGLNKKMYEDCMASGKHSHDICYEYTYLQ